MFGNSTAGGAYLPGMSDYTVFVTRRRKVFLGGPPLVKMATGEDADDEELGGAEMHARTSGLADYLAEDEHDALRHGPRDRRAAELAQARPRRRRLAVRRAAAYDAEDLLGDRPSPTCGSRSTRAR